jgi:hypothetical protein
MDDDDEARLDRRLEREWWENHQREHERRKAEVGEQLRKDLEAMPDHVKKIEERFRGQFEGLYGHLFFVYCALFALFCAIVWLVFR